MHFCLHSLHGAMKIRKSISPVSSQCAYHSFHCSAYFSLHYLRHMHVQRRYTRTHESMELFCAPFIRNIIAIKKKSMRVYAFMQIRLIEKFPWQILFLRLQLCLRICRNFRYMRWIWYTS